MQSLPCVLLMAAAVAPPAPAADAGVREVVVFPDRALVTRARTVTCPARGRATVAFPRLPAAADARSLRAEARSATVEGLRTAPTADRAAAPPRQLLELDDRIAALTQARGGLDRRDGLVDGYLGTVEATVALQLRRGDVDPGGWTQALRVLERTGRAAAAERAELEATLARLAAERAHLEPPSRRIGLTAETSVEVLISCRGAGPAEVQLQYLVSGASWTPAYDLQARDGTATATMIVHADVRQSTGEDWLGARLLLTTARPADRVTPPELLPLDVRALPREVRQRIVARAEAVPKADAVEATPARAAGSAVATADQGQSVRLTPERPADVPGDGTLVRLLAATLALPARAALRAVPRLDEQVFRVADIVNRAPFPLLPGPMKVFREGSFVGTQPLERPIPAGARWTVSLGLEEQVSVRRIVLEEISQTAGLFGGRRHHRHAYRFELDSYLDRPIAVELVDHLPVSELGDVRVVVDPKRSRGWTTEGDSGLARQVVRLAPRANTARELTFRIEVPASYD